MNKNIPKKAFKEAFLRFFRAHYFLIFVGFLVVFSAATALFYQLFLWQLESREPVVTTPHFQERIILEVNGEIERRREYLNDIPDREYESIFFPRQEPEGE